MRNLNNLKCVAVKCNGLIFRCKQEHILVDNEWSQVSIEWRKDMKHSKEFQKLNSEKAQTSHTWTQDE